MTTILSLNIDGGAREAALQQYLAGKDPDVFVLTEWRDNAQGAAIKTWAERRGMHCQGLVDGGDPDATKRNGILIASKIPFSWRSATPAKPANDPTRSGVLLLAQAEFWTILACYLPQGKSEGDPITMT
jgi:exonuclease III